MNHDVPGADALSRGSRSDAAAPEAGLAHEIRRRREAAGLSQNQLGNLIGYSRQYVSRAERPSAGLASGDLVRVLDSAFSAEGALIALHARLLDQRRARRLPIRSAAQPASEFCDEVADEPAAAVASDPVVSAALGRVEQALMAHDALGLLDGDAVLTDSRELAAAASAAHARYQGADYGLLLEDLPNVITAADRSRPAAAGDYQTADAYVAAYVVVAKLLAKLGASEFALLAADRAAIAAEMTESPVAHGMAAFQVVAALLESGQVDHADKLATTTADRLTSRLRTDDPSLTSVAGSLWLISAVVAARRGDESAATYRLRRADTLAGKISGDANHAWTAFGPTNTAIHRVSVYAELGRPAEALDAAGLVDLKRLPVGLRGRRVQIHLDLAWVQAQRGRDSEATLHLMQAEQTAPDTLRHNVLARRTLHEMLGRATSTTVSLARLAARAGAVPV